MYIVIYITVFWGPGLYLSVSFQHHSNAFIGSVGKGVVLLILCVCDISGQNTQMLCSKFSSSLSWEKFWKFGRLVWTFRMNKITLWQVKVICICLRLMGAFQHIKVNIHGASRSFSKTKKWHKNNLCVYTVFRNHNCFIVPTSSLPPS